MMIRFSLFKVIQMILPWIRRKVRFIAWTKVFVSYLARILEQLWQFWEATAKECKMTPQIMYLEHLLNDRYGITAVGCNGRLDSPLSQFAQCRKSPGQKHFRSD